jgi:hypothetical protein
VCVCVCDKLTVCPRAYSTPKAALGMDLQRFRPVGIAWCLVVGRRASEGITVLSLGGL